MAVILRGAIKLYYYLNEEIAGKYNNIRFLNSANNLCHLKNNNIKILDPRTQEWHLMRTPWPGLSLMVLYLFAVFKWLPEYMKKRPPYNLRAIIAAYNVVQIGGCMYVVYQVSLAIIINIASRLRISNIRYGQLHDTLYTCSSILALFP
jgi:hypothetical protein